ncbi:MrcB family domain-containing protein [Streptomyces sp. NBC_00829]|uniref:MrcB family domain-containing protein n=1 Tax=Streptomyces sp. NBC_00829 TaxID=2903679 RepID=UPI0038651172|nr:DUF3578 domain-containing protein [Streptomyces sp. NBC_00829]
MDIRDLLLQVASTYDRTAGTTRGVGAQDLLRSVGQRSLALPPGYVASGYGGQGSASSTPWIGVFDPDVSRDPKQGLYLAYIFSAELTAVTLTLQQGMTLLEKRFQARRDLNAHLEQRAALLHRVLPERLAKDWRCRPSFRGTGWRPAAYEAGSIAARRYDIANMPEEVALREDLSQAASLLQRAATAERLWWFEDQSKLEVEYPDGGHGTKDPLDGFRPKSSDDYIANIAARQQVKKRSHEALIATFGRYIVDRGYVPTTVGMHPKDLVLRREGAGGERGDEWLVEAKVVSKGNPTSAVRGAVGQLLEYSHFLYRERGLSRPHLLGLFTEDIGVYAPYLEDHGIAAVWQSEIGWAGSASALTAGLVS